MSRINPFSKFRKVTHVIFDMDGVLLDTEYLYTKAIQNIVSKFGKTFDWSVKIQMMGQQGRDAAKTIINLLDLPITVDEWIKLASEEYAKVMIEAEIIPDSEGAYKNAISTIAKTFGKVYTPEIMSKVVGTVEKESARIAVTEMQLPISVDKFQAEFHFRAHENLRNVPLMPGAKTLVTHFHKNNIPIAVATSSASDSFELKTKLHKEFFKLFSHVICGGTDPEVKNGKPAPDIFLLCASRFSDKPAPVDCLVFEDSPNGVQAAKSAGMQVVMIPDENIPPELQKDADVIVQSLEDTDLNLFGLPPLR